MAQSQDPTAVQDAADPGVAPDQVVNPDPTSPPSSETMPAASTQPTLEAEAQPDADDAIVITGSRLVRPDLEAPSPVTTVDSEQFDLTGTVTVETLLNELPQIIPGNTRTSNNQGGEDFSTIDLRGLGPNRTLILVDGERVPASSSTGVVDIGTIPAGLIERVDVVTGGASAVYGSDAMAGVVNFILKDNFEGLELTSQYSITEAGDGATFNVQGLLGGNFADDRGNMTLFASYYTRESIGQGDRDLTRNAAAVVYDYDYDCGTNRFGGTGCEIQYFVADHLTPISEYPSQFSDNPNAFTGFVPAGSATNPYGTIVSNASNPFRNLSTLLPATFGAGNTDTNCDGVAGGAVNGGTLSFNDAGQLTPSNTSGLCAFADRSVGSSRYNFNPANFLVTPYQRYSLAGTARYDINDSIRLKLIGNYVDSEQTVNLAPTPATGIVVTPTSPLIPADLAVALASRTFFTRPDALNPATPSGFVEFGNNTSSTSPLAACSTFDVDGDGDSDPGVCTQVSGADRPFTVNRRFAETGPRIGIYNSKTATLRGTLSGPLAYGFNWDATASWGKTDVVINADGNINNTAVREGLLGCPAGSSLPGCVPIDIFGPDTLTPAMLSFVRVDTKETRSFDQVRIAGNITGNLIELPAGPLGIAVGAEARTDRGTIRVDDAQRTGNIYGFNATQDQEGKVNVKELYGEVRVPILADMPFFHELSLEAGARFSEYSSVGGLFNYKLGAQWSPIEWVKFRAIYNKAARAPSIVELFQSGDQGFPTVNDPCNAAGRTSNELAVCQAQAPAVDFTGFQQVNSQAQAFAFGNPNLSEEQAKTYTIGAVLTPNIGLGRFSATIDYYNIKIDDVISVQGAQFYLDNCAQSGDPNNSFCLNPDGTPRIVRDPQTGQIVSVNTSIENSNTFKTSGVDAQLNFVVPFADLGLGIPGRLRLQELVTWTNEIDFGTGFDFAGRTASGIGGTFPEWKSTLTAAYDSDDFTAQVRWNWNSDLQDVSFGCFLDDAEGNAQFYQCAPDVKGLNYFDLSLRKSIGDNFELTGIVNNLFNQKGEKTVSGFGAEGGVDVSYFNPIILGRVFTIAAKVKM